MLAKIHFLWLALFKPNRTDWMALLLGAISVLAFAPFKFSAILLFTLVAIFSLWQRSSTWLDAAKTGLWFGLGLFGAGASWLFSSMYFYADVWMPFAITLTFSFVFYLSLYVALAGGLSFYLKSKSIVYFALVLPSVWVLAELLRATVFEGYPFLLTGNSHVETWLNGYAPVLGVWGVSFALATTAGLILYMFQHKRWLVSAFGVVLIWLSGWGLQQVQWTEPKGKAVDIALLQGNIPQEKKWLASEFYASMQTYINLTKQNLGADLIVWPETAVPAYFDVVEKGALKSFLEDVQLLDKDVVVGVIDGGVNSVNYYNAIINLNHPDEQRYYKRHLVPFSEYFPFDSVFASLAGLFDIPYATFSEGPEHQALFEIGDNKVSVSVCYEMSFGEELADFLPEAHYLVTVSNDAWFAHTLQPAQQLQEVQMRALELGREIARSTNTGLTAIVAKDGQIKQVIPAYEEGVLVGQIQPYQGATFYALWQRWPITLFVGVVIGLAVLRRRDANKSLFSHRGSKS